jgi:hypothetical protein
MGQHLAQNVLFKKEVLMTHQLDWDPVNRVCCTCQQWADFNRAMSQVHNLNEALVTLRG